MPGQGRSKVNGNRLVIDGLDPVNVRKTPNVVGQHVFEQTPCLPLEAVEESVLEHFFVHGTDILTNVVLGDQFQQFDDLRCVLPHLG